MPTYARAEVGFERGEGPYLWGTDGRRYLDFACGIAVTGLGHAHPHLVKEVGAQMHKVWHTSNIFPIPLQEKLAQRLVASTFADTVFFGNSGAEANECGIKLVRKYHAHHGHPERFRIITFEGAFHGRTIATLAAGGQQKYLEGFGPKADGFDQVPFGDEAALKAAIGPATAGILIEPIQGEGGVRPVPVEFLKLLRELCDANGLLLFFDEIQTGMGRTGRLFAYEWSGVTPDVMSVAKALGNGFPVGACLATAKAAAGMTAGTHGSTYGGNPLAMSAGNAVLDVMLAPGFFEQVERVSGHLKQQLAGLVSRNPDMFEEARGQGLLLGLKCKVPNQDMILAVRKQGLLTAGAGDNVMRLLPPLIAEAVHVAEAIEKIDAACADLRARAPSRKVG
ncbi:MAG: acetylornithine/succinylornithine family transaminase [Alphaproteobacteria bacterium]|nr:acetylornithine/succinylornithine family transaminase [Alphaproteobacteria bacterium]